MSADTPEDVTGLWGAGRLVAATLELLEDAVAPGVSTLELDRQAASFFEQHGARSGPILTYDYPGAICISVDDEVVHGIPGSRVLRAGQLVTLDVALELDGYHADAAVTIPVGEATPAARELIDATRAALSAGIDAAQAGAILKDVGAAIETTAQARGYDIFRPLTGHGIGRQMHEEPTVFNWAAPAATTRLTAGLVFTIEPMLTAGSTRLHTASDGWTISTADGSLSAHAEHTIMVAATGPPTILTARNAP